MLKIFSSRATLLVAAALALTTLTPAKATRAARVLKPPATAYLYAGVVYDRLFAVTSRPRRLRNVMRPRGDVRLRYVAAAPYSITDLTPIAANAILQGPLDGFGFPTAVNNAGHITYYDLCECAGNTNNIAIVIDDSGKYSRILYENEQQEGADSAIPYAISTNGNSAGEDDTQYGPSDSHETAIAWSQSGFLYQSALPTKPMLSRSTMQARRSDTTLERREAMQRSSASIRGAR